MVSALQYNTTSQKILLVREGGFSFSACCAVNNMVATSLDSEEALMDKHRSSKPHSEELERLGRQLLHEVDQKVVIAISTDCQKCRSKAMKIAISVTGVESAALKGEGKNQLEVVGVGIDAVVLTTLLRKNVGFAEVVCVGPNKKDTEKKNEATIMPPLWVSYPPIHESAALKGEGKNQLEVVGDRFDTVVLTRSLRKNVGFAKLVSVGPFPEDIVGGGRGDLIPSAVNTVATTLDSEGALSIANNNFC
ncbi:hypothetical protein RJ640_011867 [Escallonia rubra]|uniref:25S rRNA (uridine-N(3))-methyltransferase BMT5-like domain-containing protein n=1 Tax=Escallonia rubra TaxID=112253 RepID=A0AA88UIL9_9ASTE|nr:hypothetical protein RJ640_011867 [Escallonia rubra]